MKYVYTGFLGKIIDCFVAVSIVVAWAVVFVAATLGGAFLLDALIK